MITNVLHLSFVRGTKQLCDIRRPAMVALVYLCVPSRQLPSSLREHLVVADSLVLHDARSKTYGTSRRLLSLKPVLRPCVSCLLAGHCRRSQRRHLRHGGHLYNSVPVHLDKNGTTTRRACCHWSYLHNKSASQLCTDHEHDRTHKGGLACGFMIAIGIIIYRELKANGNAIEPLKEKAKP